MIGRAIIIVFYILSLMGSGAVVVLLLAAALLHWFNVDQFGELLGFAIQIGASLCVLSIGVRLAVSTWIWLKTKMVTTHG